MAEVAKRTITEHRLGPACDSGCATIETEELFGLAFAVGKAETLADAATSSAPPITQARLMVTANVDHLRLLRRREDFRRAYRDAWLRTIDGIPILLYARLTKRRKLARIAGADLFPLIVERLKPDAHRPAFIVSSVTTGNAIFRYLQERGFDVGAILIISPLIGFDADPTSSAALAERMARFGATHVFLGVGSPKSELWAYRHRNEIGPAYVFSFGAGLDYFAGTKRRAPQLMQRIGLEWFWRMLTEPKRLIPRYASGLLSYSAIVVQDRLFGIDLDA